MERTLEARFHELRLQVEGYKNKIGYDHSHGLGMSAEERLGVTPINPWHRRILSELDFCLQMKAHAGTNVEKAVGMALDLLEKVQKTDGVWTNEVCRQAENCLMPLAEEAHTYTLLMAGHAHLDMNWQWGWDETVATVIATFRTVLRLMEEYPEFCFSQSQASTYKIVDEYAPDMKPEIRKRIQEGRWEITATEWVETDKNMPCTESLLNHILYTKKYFEEEWGIDSATLDLDFLPDTFGHSAFVPEINAMGGVKYYYHCRGLGQSDKILYRWQAPSGKEVLMYKEPYWYNSGISADPAIGLPRMAKMCSGLRTGLSVYGVGDHGGGPTRRDLNRVVEMQKWPVFPIIRFARLHDYFEAAESVRAQLPVLTGELNCIYTGCYTTQSRVKRGNRRAETALLNAEKIAALSGKEWAVPYREDVFEKEWRKVLFTHFHDILTGSCTQDSREYAMGLYQEVLAASNSISANALERLAKAIDTSNIEIKEYENCQADGAGVGYGLQQGCIPTSETGTGKTRIMHIFNSTGVSRKENVKLTIWDWPGSLPLLDVTDAKGNEIPFERVTEFRDYWSHRYFEVLVTVEVPAYGYTTVVLKEKEPTEVTNCFLNTHMDVREHKPFEDVVLENKYLCAKFDCRTGQLYSFIDKATGNERIREGETAGLYYIAAQRHGMSSWVIDRWVMTEKITQPVKMNVNMRKLSSGLQMEHVVAHSRVTTTFSLGSEDKHLRVKIQADWKEESKKKELQPVLTWRLPLKENTGRMLCDVPGGVLWRTEQEIDVPCQRYGAAELADGRVLALASDCKYGFRLSKNDLYVTLINTSENPDPYPERGIHEIVLYVMPANPKAVELSRDMDVCMNPMQYVTNTSHEGLLPTTGSFLESYGATAVFTGIARRDGHLAIRMHEAEGQECPITIRLNAPATKAYLTDMFGNISEQTVEIDDDTIRFCLQPYTQAELRILEK